MASLEVTLPVTILYGTDPSPTAGLSSTPVTIIVCATFQLLGVNITLLTAIVPSPVLSLLKAIVTSDVGCEVNTMVNDPVPPSSLVMLSVTNTVAPATSSSVIVNVCDELVPTKPWLKLPIAITTVSSPSDTWSDTTDTTTSSVWVVV